MLSPKTVSSHPKLRLLRSISHKKTISVLLDDLFPCAVKAKNTTSGEPFSNFNRVLYTYYVTYCRAEGLTRVHDQTREVLLFVFHGKYKSPNGCDVPVIREIHKTM